MISFLASDYILNTAGYVLQKHGILKYDLTRKDVRLDAIDWPSIFKLIILKETNT